MAEKKVTFENGIYCCLDENDSGFGFDTEAYSLIKVKNADVKSVIDSLLKKRTEKVNLPKEAYSGDLDACDKLTFIMTNNCNMKCSYCYYKDSFDKLEIRKNKLTADQILEKYICFCGLYSNGVSNVHFFGGEPLIEYKTIFDAILLIEKYCIDNQKDIPAFLINTNGLLFNKEIIDFFYAHKVSITVSLDGKRENNSCRVRKDGSETFDDVIKNVKKIKELYPDYILNVETTFTTKNVMNFIETKKHDVDVLYDAGFSLVHFAPAMLDEDDPLNPLGKDFDIENTLEYVKYAYDFMFKNRKHFIVDDYYGLILPIKKKVKRNVDCFAGVKKFTITPEGVCYPCQIVTTEKEYAISNDILSDKKLFTKYVEDSVKESMKKREAECSGCWCKNLCYKCLYQEKTENLCRYKRETNEYLLNCIVNYN